MLLRSESQFLPHSASSISLRHASRPLVVIVIMILALSSYFRASSYFAPFPFASVSLNSLMTTLVWPCPL